MSDLTRKYIADLDAGVRDLFASDRWRSYLEFPSQNSTATAPTTQSRSTCSDRLHLSSPLSPTGAGAAAKCVKAKHGIKILAPHTIKDVDDETGEIKQRLGFHLAYCFDVSQTDGKDLPEGPARQLTGSVDGYAHIWDTLLAVSPVPVSIEPIEDCDANGYYSHTDQRIVVRDGLAELQRVKTAIHEIAHALLHAKGAEEADADRSTREVQAESVAYVVCRAPGPGHIRLLLWLRRGLERR